MRSLEGAFEGFELSLRGLFADHKNLRSLGHIRCWLSPAGGLDADCKAGSRFTPGSRLVRGFSVSSLVSSGLA
jgi:hypothetical protein